MPRFIPIFPYSAGDAFRFEAVQLHIAQDLIEFKKSHTRRSPLDYSPELLILDNGAFEGHPLLEHDRFIREGTYAGRDMQCHSEYVAPDTLHNGPATNQQLDQFASEYRKQFRVDLERYYGAEYRGVGVMFVPQGHDITSWLRCFHNGVIRHGDIITTIGIPKWVASDKAFADSVDELYSSHTSRPEYGVLGGALSDAGFSLVNAVQSDLPELVTAVSQQVTRLKMLWIIRMFSFTLLKGYTMPNLQFHMLGLANFTELGLHPNLDRNNLPFFFDILRTIRSIDSSIVFNLTHKKNQTNKFLDIAYNSTLVGPPYKRAEDLYLDKLIDVLDPNTGMPDDVRRPDNFFKLPESDFSNRNSYNLNMAIKTHLGRR